MRVGTEFPDMSDFLDQVMNDAGRLEYGVHGGTKTQPRKRSRAENARRKAVREKLQRGLEVRKNFSPKQLEEEEARIQAEINAILVARRAQDQDQAA